ncbi:hypothetical protein M3Y95_00062000 [Aphelenchoides besseyi]|nr:hypothetical protein M3Y95_00062000 [Aphelenchoides besseyi]
MGRWLLFPLLFSFVIAKDWFIKIDTQSNELSLSAGKDARVKCSVGGLAPTEKPTIQWKSKSGTRNTGQLLLRNPTVKDSGEYSCVVNVNGEEEAKTIEISFVEFPKFLDFPRDQHPEIGSEARIVCNVSKPEQAEVFWTIDNRQVVRDDRIEFADDNTVLIIKNFTSSDNNVYTCNIPQEANGIASADLNVVGYVRPQIYKFDYPEKAINEGADATFACQFSGEPKPHLQWRRITQSHRPENVTQSEKYAISNEDWASILTIRNVSDVDVGTYGCKIESVLGVEEQSKSLQVNSKPRILKNTRYFANLGESIEIPCVATGLDVHLEWFVDADRVPTLMDENQQYGYVLNDTGLVLVYRNVSENENKKFVCVAKNDAGSDKWNAHVDLTRSPEITSHPPSFVRVVHGNGLSLACEGSGIPQIEWIWYHNNALIEGVNDLFFVNASEAGKTVLDVKANSRGAGDYYCEARNILGSVKSPLVTVLLIEPPRLPEVLCGNHSLPNRAYCYVDFESVNQNRLPTHYTIELLPSADALMQDSVMLEIPFNGSVINIRPLNSSSQFKVRFQAHNEAGTSEWSEYKDITTTDPWSPEPVTKLESNCDSTDCTFSWNSSDDNGSPIVHYRVLVSQANNTEANGFERPAFVGDTKDNRISITSLPPNSEYKMRVVAKNEVGESDATEVTFHVGDKAGTSTILTFALICLILMLIAIGVVVIVVTKCRKQFNDKNGIANGATVEEGENLVPGSSTSPTSKRLTHA